VDAASHRKLLSTFGHEHASDSILPDLPIYYLGVLPGMTGPCYGYDNSTLSRQTSSVEPPPIPGGGDGDPGFDPGVPPANYPVYGTNDLWLDLTGITNDLVSLTFHNTQPGMYCQLLTNRDLRLPKEWGFGRIVQATNNTTLFAPEPKFWDKSFYRAVEGFPIVSIFRNLDSDAMEPTNGISFPGFIQIALSDSVTNDLQIFYKISGSAQNGVDYSNISDHVTILSGQSGALVEIDPIQDTLIEFEEFVTLTLILTNGYVVDPSNFTATIRIADNFGSNVVENVIAVNGPDGLDYSPTTHSLISSCNHPSIQGDGEPFNFERIFTNGVSTNVFVTNWSGIHGMTDEIKLATVKTSAAGFTAGDMYFGTGVNGIIGKLSADGTVSNLNYFVLSTDVTNTDTLIRGSLYIDDSGSFGGDLIAVTGNGEFEGGGVWRINSSGTATLLTTISNTHLEGAITITNDVAKYGPFAGKIITGAESATNEYGLSRPVVYAISTNGAVQPFDLGIAPEDFDIIKPGQDLYCLDESQLELVKVSSTLLTNYWGDLLITEEGAFGPDGLGGQGRLFIVHWDNSNTNFVIRSITHGFWFEHCTFAPINLPSHQP
jgi:hypothetical protein